MNDLNKINNLKCQYLMVLTFLVISQTEISGHKGQTELYNFIIIPLT